MALRSEAVLAAAAILSLSVGQALSLRRPLRPPSSELSQFEARHGHLKGACTGALTFDETGLKYDGSKHKWAWPYAEIQRLELSAEGVRVLTYQDNRWRLGADREVHLEAKGLEGAYPFLRERLDERLVARVADADVTPLWEAPAKLLGRFGGAPGTLVVGEDRIVFRAGKDSRTWRYRDLENVATSGPFELTLATLDGTFRFQLKQRLEESRYDELWRKVSLR
jgi:hypothetical protein